MNVQSRTIQAELDPIEAEIIRFGLLAIPKQIEVNITRTAYSPLVYEYKDYAVGIVDADARLVANSQGGIPLFVANALGVAVRDGLLVHGRDGIAPGDVIISNHAGTLGQHLNNVVMYTPIHAPWRAGRLHGRARALGRHRRHYHGLMRSDRAPQRFTRRAFSSAA